MQKCKDAKVQGCKCARMQMCKDSNEQVCKCVRMQKKQGGKKCKEAKVQGGKSAKMKRCKDASVVALSVSPCIFRQVWELTCVRAGMREHRQVSK